jgi:3-methyladenine DNA glycosylase AlkD
VERVTAARMDAQARAFDNWAICDTLCFALWVRSPHAFAKIEQWSDHRAEYVKRASFALLASMALKHKTSTDADYLRCLPLIESAADDERNFVKKGVSWALRGIGRRSVKLNKASIALAKKLAASENAAPRWIGKDALRELSGAVVQKRLK